MACISHSVVRFENVTTTSIRNPNYNLHTVIQKYIRIIRLSTSLFIP